MLLSYATSDERHFAGGRFIVWIVLVSTVGGCICVSGYATSKRRRRQRPSSNSVYPNNNHQRYRPLHHAPRQKDPLAVEYDLPQRYILGSDESGTGSLAGPIVTATCCLVGLKNEKDCNNTNRSIQHRVRQDPSLPQPDWFIPGVQDGKRLSRRERFRIFQQIQEQPQYYKWTVSIRSPQQIDTAESVSHAIADCFAESIERLVTELELEPTRGLKVDSLPTTEPVDATSATSTTDFRHDILSIVDGPSSPKGLSVLSRPWVGGDNTVYTIALASILAHVTRDRLLDDLAQRYPKYGLERHKGYGTPAHLAAIRQYGPSPIHRYSCKLVRNAQRTTPATTTTTTSVDTTVSSGTENGSTFSSFSSLSDSPNSSSSSFSILRPTPKSTAAVSPIPLALDRASFLSTAASVGLFGVISRVLVPELASAMYSDSKTGTLLPDVGEIASAIPQQWEADGNPFVLDGTSQRNSKLFARLDSSQDSLFYQEPRFVEHVDEQAVQTMTSYIANVLKTVVSTQKDDVAVLDLCSSWTSHFPSSLTTTATTRPLRVAGLGMNANELRANPSLTEWTVQDLNDNPVLPFQDASFDVVFCQLSIDYLTQPLEVCREIGRILRPGGAVHILFSNRLFLSKAVALWTGADDVDHAYTVGSYLHFCQPELFATIDAQDLSVRNPRSGRIVGDPLYVVTATKKA